MNNTKTYERTGADTATEHNADIAAIEGKWAEHAQPGFEAKVGEIATQAAKEQVPATLNIDIRSAEDVAWPVEVHKN